MSKPKLVIANTCTPGDNNCNYYYFFVIVIKWSIIGLSLFQSEFILALNMTMITTNVLNVQCLPCKYSYMTPEVQYVLQGLRVDLLYLPCAAPWVLVPLAFLCSRLPDLTNKSVNPGLCLAMNKHLLAWIFV